MVLGALQSAAWRLPLAAWEAEVAAGDGVKRAADGLEASGRPPGADAPRATALAVGAAEGAQGEVACKRFLEVKRHDHTWTRA